MEPRLYIRIFVLSASSFRTLFTCNSTCSWKCGLRRISFHRLRDLRVSLIMMVFSCSEKGLRDRSILPWPRSGERWMVEENSVLPSGCVCVGTMQRAYYLDSITAQFHVHVGTDLKPLTHLDGFKAFWTIKTFFKHLWRGFKTACLTDSLVLDWSLTYMYMYMYMFNERLEGRKKEASKVKQQTTRQSNTAHPRQSLFI